MAGAFFVAGTFFVAGAFFVAAFFVAAAFFVGGAFVAAAFFVGAAFFVAAAFFVGAAAAWAAVSVALTLFFLVGDFLATVSVTGVADAVLLDAAFFDGAFFTGALVAAAFFDGAFVAAAFFAGALVAARLAARFLVGPASVASSVLTALGADALRVRGAVATPSSRSMAASTETRFAPWTSRARTCSSSSSVNCGSTDLISGTRSSS